MNPHEYQIGKGKDALGVPIWVGYSPPQNGRPPEIYVQMFSGRNAKGPCRHPQEILEFRPHNYHYVSVGVETKIASVDQEPPGWFERKCAEIGCSWFVPFVKQMAEGKDVTLEIIQAQYREHNGGQEMPCGLWRVLFD